MNGVSDKKSYLIIVVCVCVLYVVWGFCLFLFLS